MFSQRNDETTLARLAFVWYNLGVEDVRLLIERIAGGDKDALRRFIEVRGGFIRSSAGRVLSDSQLLEDVVSEVVTKVWFNAAKIRHYKNIDGFIFTVAYNAAIDIKRKSRLLVPLTDALESSLTAPSHDADTVIAVNAALEKLSPDERQILVLRSMYNYSYYECADALGISYFQARRLYARAAAAFKSVY